MTFMKHSCSPAAARKCLGKDARCIVDSFEISLSGAYEKGAAGGIYPSFYPSDEEMKDWERRGINMTGSKKLWGSTSWIHGKEYYRYLVDEFDFPLLKVKAVRKANRRHLAKTVECYRMTDDSFFDLLVFPTKETVPSRSR